jgi:hypothetical protein
MKYVFAPALQWPDQAPRRNLTFRQESGLQRYAEFIGCSAEGKEASIEARTTRKRRCKTIGCEPSRPAHLLVIIRSECGSEGRAEF